MNALLTHWHQELASWLDQQTPEQAVAETIWATACSGAWQRYPDGRFGPDHAERGLLLHWILAHRDITRVLQVETGFGYTCTVMAQTALQRDVGVRIDTLDVRPPTMQQAWWVHHKDGDRLLQSSVEQVLAEQFPKVCGSIYHYSGRTHKQLYRLLKEGARYGLIVLSARSTPYELLRDLCYCIPMLEDDGAIVLERFAPTKVFGLGGVMLLPHLRRLFVDVSMYATQGRVWPMSQSSLEAEQMLVASGHRFPEWRLHKSHLLLWRITSWFMGRAYSSAYSFPLKPDVD